MAGKGYRRVLLKLSGEALTETGEFGLNGRVLQELAERIAKVVNGGTELAIVVGGGNIWRYSESHAAEIERATSDTMGMLATVMNGIALQNALEKEGVDVRVQTALTMPSVAEPYIRRRAVRHLEKGRVVIFAAGTGNPYFTTDTAAALRALEIHAEILLKGTKVAGVFDRDPVKHKDAKHYPQISYNDMLTGELKVIDAAAVSLCRDNDLPILIFDIWNNDLADAVAGKPVGTKVVK